MPILVLLVAAAAALGVGLVVYGLIAPQRGVAPEGPRVRASTRTLAEVREQLRRRFEQPGTPSWIATDTRTTRLVRDLASADLDLRPYEFRVLQGVLAIVLALLSLLRFGFSPAVIAFALFGFVAPVFYLRNRRGRRLRLFDAGLPRAMELMANSMKAGQSIAQAIGSVADNAVVPVSDEFALARREMELGASVESSLSNMVGRIGSTDLRLMVMVITIQHSVGGDLPAILITLADTMKQRAEMRAEILAATAQSRASALIVTLLPVAAAVFLFFLVPAYFRPMFTNLLGWILLGIAAILLVVGNFLIRRLTAIT